MKLIIVLSALIAVALCRPQSRDADAKIVQLANDNIGVGGFQFKYETSNGIAAEEAGQVVNEGREDESLVVRGSYKFLGSDGVTYTVTYIADANGFQPQGVHLPH